MFAAKKTKLFDAPVKAYGNGAPGQIGSAFINTAMKEKSVISSNNGAKKYSTTGNDFVDQFGKLGDYKKPRPFSEIEKDCEKLWAQDRLKATLFTFYIRMITRTVSFEDGTKTEAPHRGAELRHEGIMRMIWLHLRSPKTFWKNVGLFVAAGSWKDVITMLQYDLIYNGWDDRKLDWDKFGKLIVSGLNNENTNNLLKKYLPQVKAKSVCKTVESQADTLIAKWICSLLFGKKDEAASGSTYKLYRKLKNSGTAHEWQKLISQKKHDLIDFGTIHGRALNLLVKGKFLDNQGLKTKYENWVSKPDTELKYTGFVHELFEELPDKLSGLSAARRDTIDKQFATLVAKAGAVESTKLIVVRDTSGSMASPCDGTKLSCYAVGKALSLYFSEFLTGKFASAWIEFNSDAQMHTWKGNTALERWYNDRSGYYGGTDFQSVLRLFCSLRAQGVPESEFPTGILCISDSEFNPSSLSRTNVEDALIELRRGGFSKDYVDNFIIVLWNLQGGNRSTGRKFETHGDVPNVFYFSGFSAATVSFLTSKIRTASELFDAAMDQELLNKVELIN